MADEDKKATEELADEAEGVDDDPGKPWPEEGGETPPDQGQSGN